MEKEQKRSEAHHRRGETARERDRERLDKATAKAQTALGKAEHGHARRAANIQIETLETEENRLEKQTTRLKIALRKARD